MRHSHDSLRRDTRVKVAPRAFALPELLGVVFILTVVVAALAVLIPDSRQKSRLGGSLTNLQRLGAGFADYAIDREDAVATFTWRAGPARVCGDGFEFPASTTDLQAAANQGVCILRTLGQRPDINPFGGWVPHISYNLLPLMEYLNEPLPSTLIVSPGDRLRLQWQQAARLDPNDPEGAQWFLPCSGLSAPVTNSTRRLPFSSSYEVQPSFFSPDLGTPSVPTISQNAMGHRWYNIDTSATPLGRRRVSEVVFPSQKALVYETNQRFFGSRQPFFMYPSARIPILLADGSASVKSMSVANDGWDPRIGGAAPTRVNYVPETLWESPTENGAAGELVNGTIRWTQRGLQGRDFGGPEIVP